MPGLIQQPQFKTITVKELHPTFGAEIQGVDFDNLPDEQFNEIKAALAKVSPPLSQLLSQKPTNLLMKESPLPESCLFFFNFLLHPLTHCTDKDF